ncbi:MAG TPA: DUF6345 domain-containing protein [Candidatus Paceibacterota bacterium]|nr:DUF6345 domain-containing protein [Candidatus Paceibacterota bacterium]HRT55075.1 DUF6345 domain-containing protein [Candidatus Paceibacterota bacterium]
MKATLRAIAALSILGCIQFAQAQTNVPTVNLFKFGPNQPAILEWTSQTNEVYQIEYSPDLTLGFTVAAEYVPNQGTNTIWADIGSEGVFYPRLSSTSDEVPYRFYRVAVQGYSSNSFPATVTISNIADMAVLSEATNIIASVATSSNVTSASLLLDGNQVAFDSGTDYSFAIETRLFPNGTHRFTVSVANDDESGTTGGDDVVPDQESDAAATYAAKNVSVVFSNFLSDVRLKYSGYRPDLGQTQEVHAVWASPRSWQVDITSADDTNTIYRTFYGEGTTISVAWDGLDSNGQELSPQRVGYVIYDLGEAQSMSALSANALFSQSSYQEPLEQWAMPEDLSSEPFPLAILPPGMETNHLVFFEATQSEVYPQPESFVAQSSTSFNGGVFGTEDGGGMNVTTNGPFIIFSTYKILGSFGMMFQGHHPLFGSYPRPPRGAPFGQVTFATGSGFPWGKLKAPKKIAAYLAQVVPIMGYTVPFIYADDNVSAAALKKSSLSGSNILNNVNLGLFVGHSAAGKENIVALGHPQTYIPIYNKASDSFAWVGMNDMDLGSSNLKWAAFYTCNLFRDAAYRTDACFSQMKNNNHLAMNTDLHIMQAYATEVTVHPDMGKFWVHALIAGTPNANNHTVLGAWRYVCLKTQPKESAANANVSRSIYWPECAGDYLYGYGSQTDPDPDHVQGELQEDDQTATTL